MTITASTWTSSSPISTRTWTAAGLQWRSAGQQDADEGARQGDQPDGPGLIQTRDQGQAAASLATSIDPVPA